MSLQDEHRVHHGAVRNVVIFTDDLGVIESIKATLNQASDNSSLGFELEHHSSVADRDEDSAANVLPAAIMVDVELFGSDIDQLRRHVRTFGDEYPECPLFLVGHKEALKISARDAEIRQAASRLFRKPVLGTQIMTALNLINEGKSSLVALSSNRAGRMGAMITAFGICALVAVSAFLWQGNQLDTALAMSPSPASDHSQVPSSNQASSNQTGSQSQADESLFDPKAAALLVEARSALKQGFILGPDNVNALHYYRLALNIDPYSERAEMRINQVMDELKSEFSLAIDQRKAGRSNSILKMVTELDPFNEELPMMRLRHTRAFISSRSG